MILLGATMFSKACGAVVTMGDGTWGEKGWKGIAAKFIYMPPTRSPPIGT